jgi:hypothetical protein
MDAASGLSGNSREGVISDHSANERQTQIPTAIPQALLFHLLRHSLPFLQHLTTKPIREAFLSRCDMNAGPLPPAS